MGLYWFISRRCGPLTLLFILFALTSNFPPTFATNGAPSSARFKRDATFDNYTCLAGDVLEMTTVVPSVLTCMATCMHKSTCYTVFYNRQENTCISCNRVYTDNLGPQAATGYTHYLFDPLCPDSSWVSFQRSCYKFSTPANFYDGAAECETWGGHAVYVDTESENDFLKEYVTTDNTTWAHYIGITDCAVNAVYLYYDTNVTASFLDFYPNEGVATDECCVLHYDNYDQQWADWPCDSTPAYPFPTVCEIETTV